MNTNETQQVDIPADADWIDPVKAYKKGYRAGIEKMRDAVVKEWDGYDTRCGIVILLAERLLEEVGNEV